MLATLIVALSVIQTFFLDSRRVTVQDLQAYKDSLAIYIEATAQYQAAKTRILIQSDIRDLDEAVFKNVVVPLSRLDSTLSAIDSTNKALHNANTILIQYQNRRLKQIIQRADSSNFFRLWDPMRF